MFVTNDKLEQQAQRENMMRADHLASHLALIWEVDSGSDIMEVLSEEHSSLKQLMALMGDDISEHLQIIESALKERDEVSDKENIIKAWLCCHEQRIQLLHGRRIRLPLVPPSGLCKLRLSSCSITDGALAICLGGLTSLRFLKLTQIMTLTSLPSEGIFQHLTRLDWLIIDSCWCLRSFGVLQAATSLFIVRFLSCLLYSWHVKQNSCRSPFQSSP
uniref:Rx N-terminal domain-containing protein n=1 Tax=Arundo donax TaxID=35708 RepID=A0A0A9GH27_ARUDO